MNKIVTLFLFILLVSGLSYVLNSAILDFLGELATFYTLFAFVISGAFILYSFGVYDAKVLWTIYFVFFIFMIFPHMSGFVSGERGQIALDQGKAEAEATMKNINVEDSFWAWFTGQQAMGNGTYLSSGDQEQTHEFIGVKIEGVEAWKEEFYSTEPVYIDIDYTANSYFPIVITTACKIDGIVSGVPDKSVTHVSRSQPTRVRCTFNNLPKGSHVVDIVAVYSYQSTVRIPLKFMEKSFVNTLLAFSKDSGNDITAETYVGGTENPLTNSGPISFGVSNTKKDGVSTLKMPIELDETNMNEYPTRLKIQVKETELGGEISLVNNASFDVPKGMYLRDCDFLDQTNPDLDNPIKDGDRWQYNIVDSDFGRWGNLKTISCELAFDDESQENFLPKQLRWSPQTIFFTIKYHYKLEQSTTVRVVA